MAQLMAFHKGDSTSFVCTGSIGAQVRGIEVSCIKAGNCFGEMAILDGEPCSASCITLEASELLRLSKTDFEIILKSQTSVSLGLLKRWRENFVYKPTTRSGSKEDEWLTLSIWFTRGSKYLAGQRHILSSRALEFCLPPVCFQALQFCLKQVQKPSR